MKDVGDMRIETLMMIDDNPIDQMLYKRIVARAGVVQNVICLSSAEVALDHLKATPDALPDMILLDINMPKMDGFEFLEAVEDAFGDAFCVVVVMLTTSLDPRDLARAKTFGAVKDYVDKPLTVEKVQELVELI